MPAFAQKNAIHYVAAYKQAQDQRLEADRKLLTAMEDAADCLLKFRLKEGHFPEPGLEQEQFLSLLQNGALNRNPYSATGVKSQSENKACPVRFLMSAGLNDSKRCQWEKSVPLDWKAEPGTVTVIMDSHNFVLLWGAGAERNPIRNDKSNKYALVWRDLSD